MNIRRKKKEEEEEEEENRGGSPVFGIGGGWAVSAFCHPGKGGFSFSLAGSKNDKNRITEHHTNAQK